MLNRIYPSHCIARLNMQVTILSTTIGTYVSLVALCFNDFFVEWPLAYVANLTFSALFSSNHADQAGSYAQPLLDWLPAGFAYAQTLAALAKVTLLRAARITPSHRRVIHLQVSCPATAAVFACHLAPWGFQSDDQSRYMVRVLSTSCVRLFENTKEGEPSSRCGISTSRYYP